MSEPCFILCWCVRRTRVIWSCGWLLAGAAWAQVPLPDPIPGDLPQSTITIKLAEIASGFVFATDAVELPGASGRLLVAERGGVVRLVDNGAVRAQPFLDISASTVSNSGSALSALALHPRFANAGDAAQGLLYSISQEAAGTGVADFGEVVGAAHQSVVYEWRVSSTNPDEIDLASQREILRIDETTTVHNVNDLVFAPDGLLFISKGDDDLNAAGELDGTTVHGAVLRIDLDDTAANGRYRIPATNPFVGNADGIIEEIFAYGFRNPWRVSVDRATGALFVADIGEDDIEEIDLVQPGGYYGWIDKEGSFVFLDFNGVSDDLSLLPPEFDGIDPIAEYDHPQNDRRSITGGFVYRGSMYPALAGHYVFGDLLSGELMHVDPGIGQIQILSIDPGGEAAGPGIISVRQDQSGELLLVVTELNANPTGRLLRWTVDTPPPVATDQVANTDEDQPVTISIDLSGGLLADSIRIESHPSAGSLRDNGTLTYTPNPDFHGTDAFSYSGLDGIGRRSNTASVTVNVAPVNDAPVAGATAFAVKAGDTYTGQLTATDVEGDTLSFVLTRAAAVGAVTIAADGRFSYVAPSGGSGSDSFGFVVNDGSVDSPVADVDVTISGKSTSTAIGRTALAFLLLLVVLRGVVQQVEGEGGLRRGRSSA